MITLAYAQSVIDDGTCTKKEVKDFLRDEVDSLTDRLTCISKHGDLETYVRIKQDIKALQNIIQGII
jgi:hypothetical protein